MINNQCILNPDHAPTGTQLICFPPIKTGRLQHPSPTAKHPCSCDSPQTLGENCPDPIKLQVLLMITSQSPSIGQVCKEMKAGAVPDRVAGLHRTGKPLTAELQRVRQIEAENRQLRGDVDILKKGIHPLCLGTVMSYQLMSELQKKASPVCQVCRVLQVSRSGYYTTQKWRSQHETRRYPISIHFRPAFAESGKSHGSRRFLTTLQHESIALRRYRVRGLNCWNSAVMAPIFLSLKMKQVWQQDYANHSEAMRNIADYIFGFDNNVYFQSKRGNLPPSVYTTQMVATPPIHASEIT